MAFGNKKSILFLYHSRLFEYSYHYRFTNPGDHACAYTTQCIQEPYILVEILIEQ